MALFVSAPRPGLLWHGRRWLLLVTLGIVGLGCTARPEDAGDSSAGSRPNVVVVLIDTLRADRMSLYGYDRETSPRLEALAEEAVVFERAHAPAPWTLPSVVSMMLSQPPCEHGILVDRRAVGSQQRPLARRLSEAGYQTAALYVNPYAGKLSGLDLGFDVSSLESDQIDGDRVTSWLLDRDTERPFFLYLHNTEPHDPVKVENRYLRRMGDAVPAYQRRRLAELVPEYRQLTRFDFVGGQEPGSTDNTAEQRRVMTELERLRDPLSALYDAQVRAADDRVGSIVRALERADVWSNTWLFVVSDHGEEFGEHGGWQHDQSVYEEMIHVPFVVRAPEGRWGGRRIVDRVTLLDVMPTLLDALELDLEEVRGRSLLSLLAGESGPDDEMRVTSMRHNRKKYFRPWRESRGELNYVVADGAWKGIYNAELPSLELYDLVADPGESEDLGTIETDRARTMVRAARHFAAVCAEVSRAPEASEASSEEVEALKALGYLN